MVDFAVVPLECPIVSLSDLDRAEHCDEVIICKVLSECIQTHLVSSIDKRT